MIQRLSTFALIGGLFFFAACDQFQSNNKEVKVETQVDSAQVEVTEPTSQPVKSTELTIDETATATANFIAGIEEEPYFSDLAAKPFYQKHAAAVEKEWERIHNNNLLPIQMWVRENGISEKADTLTMIYPFSGPDILYANAFFPYCKNYIMIGLEKAGSMPDLKSVKDATLDKYLESVRYSLRYINKKGYFVTTQMQKDFNQQKLDGTIHVLFYYLARTGHKITGVDEFYLDEFGKAKVPSEGHIFRKEIRGINIKFFHPKRKYEQQLYYFPFNLSDENVKKKSEFLYFVNSFGPKIFYTKSASYILHDSKFSTIRKLLLDQSQKVLQDDTGIPYFLLDNGNFRLTLYGDYTRTINDFDKQFQPRLKEALDARKQPKLLPFKIGYNAWFNETVLLYGEAISEEEKQEILAQRSAWRKQKKQDRKPVVADKLDEQLKNAKGVLFRVQFLVSSKIHEAGHPVFKGLTNVGHYVSDGKVRYTLGNATTLDDLAPFKAMAKNKGFDDAFVVAFKDGKRLSVSEAQELTK